MWSTAYIWLWCLCIIAICRDKQEEQLLQVTENINAGHNQTLSARAVCRQLHREGYYCRSAVHKPLITMMNAQLFSGAKTIGIGVEMWKCGEKIWSIITILYSQQVGNCMCCIYRMVQAWMLWCWWVWKWCESYAMAFTVTRSQTSWTSILNFV